MLDRQIGLLTMNSQKGECARAYRAFLSGCFLKGKKITRIHQSKFLSALDCDSNICLIQAFCFLFGVFFLVMLYITEDIVTITWLSAQPKPS